MEKKSIKMMQIIGKMNPGGSEKIALTLANEIKKRRGFVNLCIREEGDLSRSLNNIDPVVIPRKRLLDLSYLFGICKSIRDLNIDILHSHLVGSGIYGLMAAKLTRRKFIYTIHGNSCFIDKDKFIAIMIIARFADRIVTVSDQLYSLALSKLGIKRDKISNIPNGIDLSRYDQKVDQIQKRNELNLLPGIPIIGAIGNIKHIKGYDVLIRSFPAIKAVYEDAVLLIVGDVLSEADAKYKKILDDLISKYRLDKNILFLGSRHDIDELLSIMDIYVLSSRSEGTSLSLLEAMAARKAIVATSVGGTPYVLENGVSGLLVQSEDPGALSEGILRLLDDRAFSSELGQKGREVVEKKFLLDNMINEYLRLYEDVMST